MRKTFIKNLVVGIITVLIVSGITYGARLGVLLTDDAMGRTIQAHISNPRTLRNDSKTGTKVFQNVSTSGVTSVEIICTDANGNYKACKAKPNGQSGYRPIPYGQDVLLVYPNTTYIRFENMSGADSTTVFSTGRMQ